CTLLLHRPGQPVIDRHYVEDWKIFVKRLNFPADQWREYRRIWAISSHQQGQSSGVVLENRKVNVGARTDRTQGLCSHFVVMDILSYSNYLPNISVPPNPLSNRITARPKTTRPSVAEDGYQPVSRRVGRCQITSHQERACQC